MNNEFIYLIPMLKKFYNIEYIKLISNIFACKNNIIIRYQNSNEIKRINSEWIGLPIFISKFEKCKDIISINFTENFIDIKIDIINIPEYNLLYNGKFSKLSIETKKLILNYYFKENKLNTYKYLKAVFYKEKWLREYLSNILGYNIPILYELGSKWG